MKSGMKPGTKAAGTSKKLAPNSPLPLTEKEKSVLQFLEQQVGANGISPSYQEIKDHFGFASFNSVQNYLKQLSNKGYIEMASNQKRAIQILKPADAVQSFVKDLKPPREELLLGSPREEVLSLPLLGKVAAGIPLEAFTHDEFVEVPPSMVRNANKTFALKVSGQSMIEDGIFDGDIILVQKQSNAGNGEIVVATIDNESTVKRYFLKPNPEEPKSSKVVELRPANSTMKSMWYPPQQVEIQGILVGLIRKF